MRLRGVGVGFLAFVVLPLFTAQACGPEFFPDVFVRRMRPDKPKEFAEGKLGILQTTFPREDLTVAFRYLNGGSLSTAERAAYQPTYTSGEPESEAQFSDTPQQKASDPAETWHTVRAKYAAPAQIVEQDRTEKTPQPGGWTSDSSYLNCTGDAFRTAILTLQSRAKNWGDKSSDLADWLKGQDAVFANCDGGALVLPVAASSRSSALLQADRAYQTAAAQFYAGKFDDARKGFQAIGRDSASPWHGYGGYLAARCLVRQAFLSPKASGGDQAVTYDPALMKQAGALLEALLKEPTQGISKEAIQRELNLVRIRIEPMARLRELSVALAGPKSDPNYDQDLKDLTWYLNGQFDGKALREDTSDWMLQTGDQGGTPSAAQKAAKFSEVYVQSGAIRASAPLVDWLLTFQSPAKEAKEHALSEWRLTHQLYWLVAAIAKTSGTDAAAGDLVTAAQQVNADSPAWESVTYHRARLLIGLDKAGEARALLDQTLPKIKAGGRDSSINAYTGLRMRASANLSEFLSYAPRKILVRASESDSSLSECIEVMKDPNRKYDCFKEVSAEQLSDDAASFFNTQAPLSVWADAAGSTALPGQLRSAIAMSGWVRSVLLKDDAAAAKLFPQLPAKLQEEAGKGTGIRAVITIVRNPGLRPYLDAGVQRSYSYDFVESYRDNWWCREWQSAWAGSAAPVQKEPVAVLSKAQLAEGERQVAELAGQEGAILNLGNQVLVYANDHPSDQDVPESLYLVLRMIRYGCSASSWADTAASKEADAKQDTLKKSASRLLRQRYAASPWTKKAAPIAG